MNSAMFAVAEGYPDLKADQGFRALQQRISEIENQIADRREFYKDVVTLYNTRLRLENVLTNLDRLYFTVLMARDSILVDAWTGKAG